MGKMMTMKMTPRLRRQRKVRQVVKGSTERPRVSAYRSSKHTSAQIIDDMTGKVLAAASTQEAEVISAIEAGASAAKTPTSTKSVFAAAVVGKILGARAKKAGLSKVVFDRNGFLFHGRIKALADGAREAGLEF
jgi:large subunit ribosomal protein L18